MLKKTIAITLIFFFLSGIFIFNPAFSANTTVEYLCEFGINFYHKGKYNDALAEFKKVLLVDPDNKIAKQYINIIFEKSMSSLARKADASPEPKKPKREEIINKTLDNTLRDLARDIDYGKREARSEPEKKSAYQPTVKLAEKRDLREPRDELEEKSPAILSGECRLSIGVTPDDVIWKDANADRGGVPNQKNWRYLWGDQRHNTYDPKIYDRLKLNIETQFDSPLNAFMEITIDPWTFIGKNHVTITSTAVTDVLDMDLKYWSADRRTINETYRSSQGNFMTPDQIKVIDGKTTLCEPKILNLDSTTMRLYDIPEMEINFDYRPIRKFGVEYKQDDYYLKVFPLSDEYEALTSDDPLRISNNRVYWEESPWLDDYEPSKIFTRTSQPLKKGKWIRRLAFFSKDSSDDYAHRLTFLRGASFKLDTGSYSLETAVATPMSLWDEYWHSNSAAAALKIKVPFENNLQLGFTATAKAGLNGASLEALNQVGALDLAYQLDENKFYAEVAVSTTDIQEAKGFDTTYDGLAGKVGFIYDAASVETGFYQSGFYLAHMSSKFYPALSNYRYTRSDSTLFGKHIYFSEIKPEDRALIWGDGIDRDRNVAGFNLALKFFDEKMDTNIKGRYVRQESGKYIESVGRIESSYELNPQLHFKSLAYYQHLPKTHAHCDPLIYVKTMYSLTDYFSEDDTLVKNVEIINDKDPSIGAFSLGAKYDIFEELLSVEGIYERTNDPLDFPRGLLNDLDVEKETQGDVLYDKVVPFLYDQKFFDLPPYRYYSIGKARLIYTPTEKLQFILRYTFNENKYTSGLSDNINHCGLEATYMPTDKLTFWGKYIYSKLIDVYEVNKNKRSDFYEGHHNFFFGSEYKLNDDESFTFLYGEFVGYDNPYQQTNWSLSALDTRHIFRLFYRRKF